MTDTKLHVRRWTIGGIVQGVGFRVFVARRAEQTGLRGFVRNTTGGCVEVVATGTEAELTALEQWCADGPPGSRVDSINSDEPDIAGCDLPGRFIISSDR